MSDAGRWDVSEPYPGAMIRINAGLYYHYGIFTGDDEVVEFGRASDAVGNPDDIRVLRSSIDSFMSCGGFLEVRKYSRAERRKKRSDKDIVRCALSRVGEGGYNILHNNCQHFANECVFGYKGNTQIDELRTEINKKI